MDIAARNTAGSKLVSRRKAFHFLFWLIVTVIFLYDRRYLIQKFNLPDHFVECVAVRLLLIMSLVYFHLYYLVPKYFLTKRYMAYGLLLTSSLLVYVSLQNLYDIYLFGYVIGDVRRRDFWHAFPYNFATTSWYVLLTAALKLSLDWYEARKQKPAAEGLSASATTPAASQERFVFLKTGTKQVKTDLAAVSHIKGLKDYSIVFTGNDEIIVKGSLAATGKLFPGKEFVRVHKSYLVAIDLIRTIKDNHIILGRHSIPIGRSYKKDLYRLLEVNRKNY